MKKNRFSIRARFQSIGYAAQGLRTFFLTQHNAWLHLLAAVVAVAAGFYFRISAGEWCWIVAAIALVFVSEMANTALEFLSDLVSPGFHPQIKKVKDISAAAVLIAALGAAVIGCIVFMPKFCYVWNNLNK